MACLTELDANLLLASVLSDIAENAQEREREARQVPYGCARRDEAGWISYILPLCKILYKKLSGGHLQQVNSTKRALLQEQPLVSAGLLTLLSDTLYVGLTGEGK